MSGTIILGKPGSGKSYFCTLKVAQWLEDWVRYESAQGEPYKRKIYTNIPFDIEAISDYLAERLDLPFVDVSKYFEMLDESFFFGADGSRREWWLAFEEGAHVVLDEVHRYLGEGLARENKPYRDAHARWTSEHRHQQQDFIYITQNVDNIDRSVWRNVDDRWEIRNIKNLRVPLLQIPMQDIDVVREAWGCKQQYAVAVRGVLYQNRVVFNGESETILLNHRIFALYRSHKTAEASDRPSLRLGRLGSLLWFVRRHAWHIGLKVFVVLFGAWAILRTLYSMPSVMMQSIKTGKPEVTPVVASPLPDSPPPGMMRSSVSGKPGEITPIAVPSRIGNTDTIITGFVRGGVITPDGVLRVNDHIDYDGSIDVIDSVDVGKGIVYLRSGKKVQK